jgi:hypothetical protein
MSEHFTISNSLNEKIVSSAGNGCPVSYSIYLKTDNLKSNFQKIGNYFSIRGELLSFTPKSRELKINADGTWKRDGRDTIKPSRFARKLFGDLFTDTQYEAFGNLFKNPDYKIELISGEDIREAYHYSNAMESGPLVDSCMRHDRCQSFLDVYVQERDIRLAVIRDNGKIACRALHWTFDDDSTYLDRVYYANENYKIAMKKWGEKNCTGQYGVSEPDQYFHLTDRYEEFPYMDTLNLFDPSENTLSARYGDICLDDTEGNTKHRRYYCEESGEYIPECEAIWIESEDRHVHIDRVSLCDQCSSYELTDNFHCTYDSETICQYCLDNRDSHVTTESGNIVAIDDAIYCEYSEEWFDPDTSTVEIAGRIVVIDNEDMAREVWSTVTN